MVEHEGNHLPLNLEFKELKGRVNIHIRQAEDERKREGGFIKKDIGWTIADLRERHLDLPKFFNIDLHSDYLDGTFIEIVRHNTETNELLSIRKYIMEDIGARSSVEIGLVDLPEDKQEEEILGTLGDEEWLKYGPKVIDKLLEATGVSKEAANVDKLILVERAKTRIDELISSSNKKYGPCSSYTIMRNDWLKQEMIDKNGEESVANLLPTSSYHFKPIMASFQRWGGNLETKQGLIDFPKEDFNKLRGAGPVKIEYIEAMQDLAIAQHNALSTSK